MHQSPSRVGRSSEPSDQTMKPSTSRRLVDSAVTVTVVFFLSLPSPPLIPSAASLFLNPHHVDLLTSHPAAAAVSRMRISGYNCACTIWALQSQTHLIHLHLPPRTSQSSGAPGPSIHLGNATQRDNKPGLVVAQPPQRLRRASAFACPPFVTIPVLSYITRQYSLAPPLKSYALRQESAGAEGAGSLDKDANRAASSGADRLHVNSVQMIVHPRSIHAVSSQFREPNPE
ncbi:hypothetical protein B0H14DRAFT_2564357 [Mycena olivaceomarginata]|nr:hypothetical protein B0H14DRAFT_2564357 [Mycena olivaceomarginata]